VKKSLFVFCLALFTFILSSCGGGSSPSDAPSPTPVPVIAPSILSQPSNVNVYAGQAATFYVSATGTTLAYQWRRNGNDIVGATGALYSLQAAAADSDAVFSVKVSNSASSITSGNAKLSVANDLSPVITDQPYGGPYVQVGQTASFNVVAQGAAPLTYQWRRHGESGTNKLRGSQSRLAWRD
jgi:hypothetical protein